MSRLYARFRRHFVLDGAWADLWRADLGPSISTLPALALRGFGYLEDGAFFRMKDLAEFGGVDPRCLPEALRQLEARRVITTFDHPRSNVLHYRLSSDVVTTRSTGAHFVLPGKLIGGLAWAALSPEERAVLISLAAELRTRVWRLEHFDDELSGETLAWLERLEAVHHEHEEFETLQVRRFGVVELPRLATLSGLDQATVNQALHALDSFRGGSILRLRHEGDQLLAHLPAISWGPEAASGRLVV